MPNFYEQPILNSPYERSTRHWELDEERRPTHTVLEGRRPADFITPIPPPRRQEGAGSAQMEFDERAAALGDDSQRYELSIIINSLRQKLEKWRKLPERQWGVTPSTARLLKHWRHHQFGAIRPFFCQVEAVEAVIWLTEVSPTLRDKDKEARQIIERLRAANQSANPELSRLALKLATGAGKTTVMAMLIAWQTVNAARHPNSSRFTRGFLVVTPGITIRDRLRVLKPNDPDSYYKSRELVPPDMLAALDQAKIVIANYHALMLRERMQLAKDSRRLLQGRAGAEPDTKETKGQMLRRVMPELMGMKNIMAFNDEGHHCYRERSRKENEEAGLHGEERQEAKENSETARVWISGLEIAQRKLGLSRVIDLSATPFFLRGSGYAEGTLFPWTLCDFSLMDAIECGIVKLPRVPVADNSGEAMPMYRNLWEHIGGKMPKAGSGQARAQAAPLNPLSLPVELQSALDVLYGHYEKVFKQWQKAGIKVPPCFIVVCNNTATSKLVYDYIAGFYRERKNGKKILEHGRFSLFRNFDEHSNPYPCPRTVLIDSKQLESGEVLEENFRKIAADEIERFRREIVERGDHKRAANISDQDLLREVMNTVGKEDRLGEQTRCVVSVSMLTEGWDANTVTHVLGVRAFSTQLLCEQVVGRALRRQSYDLNEDGLFNVEYADVFGIPFDFTDAGGAVSAPTPSPRLTVRVHALSPERDACEIRFPKVKGYHVEPPREELSAKFNDDSTLELTPELVGPSITRNEGILGEGVNLTLERLEAYRTNTIAYHLTKHLLEQPKWRDKEGNPKLYLFGQLKRIARYWLDKHLVCKGDTYPAQLLYKQLAEMACERINLGIDAAYIDERPVIVVLDPYNPRGSTADVDFPTSKPTYDTDARFCHVNKVACDSSWEAEFCRMIESHPQVRAYVKNQGLGFTVPYRDGPIARDYLPDFIVRVDDGHGEQDPLNLVVEVKGRRGENAKVKKETMKNYWIPGVNRLGDYGHWAFVELRDVHSMKDDFENAIDSLQ